MSGSNSLIRFLLPCFLIVGVGIFLEAHTRRENLPPRQPLSQFPLQIGDWRGQSVPISPSVQQILGAGEFMEHDYARLGIRYPIDLFVAYYPSQRTGSTIHSPQNCLPGSGWMPVENSWINIGPPSGKRMVVNLYVIEQGLDRDLVLYWFQLHGRVVANEYWAKYYLVTDSILMNRSDGALVRIITPIGSQGSMISAKARAVKFAHKVIPLLGTYVPN
jgi:EpsI family protein